MPKKNATVLSNPHSGEEREVKNGYSWTVLLFGIFALLARKQWRAFTIAFLITVISSFLLGLIGLGVPLIISAIVWGIYAAVANEQLVEYLLAQGYEVSGHIVGDEFITNEDFDDDDDDVSI